MAIYRNIHVNFWNDSFVLCLTPEEKYFFLYLMTNPKTLQTGIYELPKNLIQFETGYNIETVEKLLNKFISYKKIKYDESTKEIMLLNWLKYNYSSSPKVKSCMLKEIKNVKSKSLIREFERICKQYGYSIDTLSQEEKKEEEIKNKNKYAEFVYMTEKEYKTLESNYGTSNTKNMIEKLNNYKGSKGKKYKSDYRAILSWVVESIVKEEANQIKKVNS